MPLFAWAGPVGTWKMYFSYRDARVSLSAGKAVYAVFGTNLLRYEPSTSEVRDFSKLDGMHGKEIALTGYSNTQRALVIIYKNGDIDFLETDDSFTNVPHLRLASDAGLTINNLSVCDDWAAVATNTGVALIDVKKRELRGFYDLGENVVAATIFGGSIFAATQSQLLSVGLNENLSNRKMWLPLKEAAVNNFLPFAGRLYFSVASSGTDFASGLWYLEKPAESESLNYVNVNRNKYKSLWADASTAVFSNASRVDVVSAQSPDALTSVEQENTWNSISRTSDGVYWAAEGTSGLKGLRLQGTKFVETGDVIGGYGPVRDLCYYMKYEDDRLLIAGGRLDPYGRLHWPGTLMYLQDDKWEFFQEEGIAQTTGALYRDMTCIAQDPSDPTHHFATAGGGGLYEFRNLKLSAHYTYDNSPLISAVPGNKNYVRTDGLAFDSDGNLWMVNNHVEEPLIVRKANGSWKSFDVPELYLAPTLERILIDSGGRVWVCSKRTTSNPDHNAGLLCLDPRGTIDNTSDDRQRYRTHAVNEDGTSINLTYGVYSLAEDHDGRIWVGTADGIYVVDDPEEWFSNDFILTQVKVPRNDGTNFADYLLAGLKISAIAVDGANRKWIGTLGSGLYLVSADGTEILQHFTEANSPLLSDQINSIAVNATTGEVMIGTEMGLCSYQGDATEPAESLSKSNISVFPNPVAHEYGGSVTIKGLTDGADVKIVSPAGHTVAGGTAIGGMFTWNCRNVHGERVGSGVYSIMISTSNAKKGAVVKIVVI